MNTLVASSAIALCIALSGCQTPSGAKDEKDKDDIINEISVETKECIALGGYELKTGDTNTLGAFIDAKVAETEGKVGFNYTREELERLKTNLTLEMLDTEALKSQYLTLIFGCRGGTSKEVASLNEIIDEVNYSIEFIGNLKKKGIG